MPRSLAAVAVAVLVLFAAGPATAATPQWEWPVETPRAIVRPFVAPATPYSAGHRGIDILAPDGTVFAPAAGVVHFAGFVVDRPVLSIRHAGGFLSSFEPVSTTLVAGGVVSRGDPIGTVEPGHCSSRCVHFGVRLHGDYLSPLNFLGGIPHSVLLPTRPP